MITQQERDSIMQREQALQQWLGKRRSYHPSELPSTINPPTNEERSKVELFDWMTDPPERYFAYPSEDWTHVVNWTGELLGKIIWAGREWRSNMGDKRTPIRVSGSNGRLYSGTIFGTYLRLRAVA